MLFDKIFKRGNDMICIDIGYRNIKVIEVNVSKNYNILIKKFGIIKTPKDCIKNGAIKNVELALEQINKVIKETGMTAKFAKIIMSGTNIITRIYMITKIEGEEPEVTIKKSIPDFLPIDVNDYQINHKVLLLVKEDKAHKYKVFVSAVAKSILGSYVEVLNGLDLKPLAVDIPSNSTAKFFNREIEVSELEIWYSKKNFKKVQNESIAVLDFGSETTIVNFLQDKILEFNKVILCGSSDIDVRIMREMDICSEDAEKLKKKYGLKSPSNSSSEEHGVVYEIIDHYMERLVKQIRNCFKFYEERCYGKPITRIFIIGGGSQLYGLRQYLFDVFNIPVYPVGLLNLKGLELNKNCDGDKLNYLINAVGISL